MAKKKFEVTGEGSLLDAPILAAPEDGVNTVTAPGVPEVEEEIPLSQTALEGISKVEANIQDRISQGGMYTETPTAMQKPLYGELLHDKSVEDYADYIDRPFSFITDDADDLRAYGQTTGEKWKYALPKLVTRVGTNILGSTVGLVYGGGQFLSELGTENSATHAFFDNDFQRSLDGINDYMDGALPHYYTKEEQNYNFWQSAGTANFWANDFSQGLSFVIGAVLSEYLSAGLGTAMVNTKAATLFKRLGKPAKYSKADDAASSVTSKMKNNIVAPQRVRNVATTARQLGTGAMYEAGVEARHHYDATLENLMASYKEEHNLKQNDVIPADDLKGLIDITTMSSNAVFASNVALVGYGNYMMFPKIFGKGYNSTRGTLSKKIKSELTNKGRAYKELFKDIGKTESLMRNSWKVLKVPLYEGFVEEGGQKLMDLTGQGAAENFYASKRDPSMTGMVSEMVLNINDKFGETYGSKEGQKEIGIGFILGALGLPGKSRSSSTSEKGGWSMQGGVWDTFRDMKSQKTAISALKANLEKSTSMKEAFERNFDALVRANVIQDSKDFAMIIDSPFMYKNAEEDEIFNYINSRLQAGFESEILDNIDHIRNMSNEEFRDSFLYNEKNDLSDEALQKRKNAIADMMLDRVTKIKQTTDMIDRTFINWGQDQKTAVIHALSIADNADIRESGIIEAIEAATGMTLEGEAVESIAERDKREDNNSRVRARTIWGRLSQKRKDEINNMPITRELKRKLGIREFTDPTHLEELMHTLHEKSAMIEKEMESVEADESMSAYEKDSRLISLAEDQTKVRGRLVELNKALNEGMDPDLSAMEQEYLDTWKATNPKTYAENSEETIQMLKDLRKLRARRHRAIDMYNTLLSLKDQNWSNKNNKGVIPPPELMLQRLLDFSNNPVMNISDKQLQRMYMRYAGKTIEMKYTTKDGQQKTYRYYVEETRIESENDKVLIRLPSYDTIELLRKKDELTELIEYNKKNSLNTLQEEQELEEIKEELKQNKHITEYKDAQQELSFLKEHEGEIQVITLPQQAKEYLDRTIQLVNTEFSTTLKNLEENGIELEKDVASATAALEKFLRESKKALRKKLGVKRLNKDQLEALHLTASEKIGELQFQIDVTTDMLSEHDETVRKIKTDVGVLHNFTTEVSDVKSVNHAYTLIEKLFEKQWGGSRSKIYKDMIGKLKKDPIKALLEDKDGDLDIEQLQQIAAILSSNKEMPIELLSKFEPQAKVLRDHLDDIIAKVADLKAGLQLKKDGEISKKQSKANASKVKELETLHADYTETSAAISDIEEDLRARTKKFILEMNRYTSLTQALGEHLDFIRTTIEGITSNIEIENENVQGPETALGMMTPAEIAEASIANPKKAFYNSMPISDIRFGKTAGNHSVAERDYKELVELIASDKFSEMPAKDKKQIEVRLAHAKSQMRFFEFTSTINKTTGSKTNMNNFRFMYVHKNSISDELAPKLTFFDKGKFYYGDEVKGQKMRSEDKESIKIIITDQKGTPLTDAQGELIYTDAPSTNLYAKQKTKGGKSIEIYRFGRQDLIPESVEEHTMANGDIGLTGELTNTAKEALAWYTNFRTNFLQISDPRFLGISRKSFALVNLAQGARDQNPSDFIRPSKSLVQKSHQVKDIKLRVNVDPSGVVSEEGKEVKVKAGFPYVIKNGNIIPMYSRELTGAQVGNIVNLFKLLAKKQQDLTGKKITKEESVRFGPDSKTIHQMIKNQVFFGGYSKTRANGQYSLYMMGDTIKFGTHGEIELAQLLDPANNTQLIDNFKEHLSTLLHQVDYFALKQDIVQQDGLATDFAALEKKWHTTKEKAQDSGKFLDDTGTFSVEIFNKWKQKNPYPTKPSPAYTEFLEYKVNEDLTVDIITWANYTEYLLGDQGMGEKAERRDVENIPLHSYMQDDTSGMETSWKTPQFKNVWIGPNSKHMALTGSKNKRMLTLEELNPKAKMPKVETKVPTEKLTVAGKKFKFTGDVIDATFIIKTDFGVEKGKKISNIVITNKAGKIVKDADKLAQLQTAVETEGAFESMIEDAIIEEVKELSKKKTKKKAPTDLSKLTKKNKHKGSKNKFNTEDSNQEDCN